MSTCFTSLYWAKIPEKTAITRKTHTDKINATGSASSNAPVIIPPVVPPVD